MRTQKHTPSGGDKAEMMQVLYEQWVQAGGKWNDSQLVLQCRSTISGTKTGGRRWMLRSDIVKKYGCEVTADEIIRSKESDPALLKTCVRDHPELKHRADLRLYLCWDESYETDKEDTTITKMLQLTDSGSKRGRSKEKKERKDKKNSKGKDKKKRKRSTSTSEKSSSQSSSSRSVSISSLSSDSSSSSSHKTRKSKKPKTNGRSGQTPAGKPLTKKELQKQEKERKAAEKKAEKEKEKEKKEAEKKQKKEEEDQRKKEEKLKKQQVEKEKTKTRNSGKKAGFTTIRKNRKANNCFNFLNSITTKSFSKL